MEIALPVCRPVVDRALSEAADTKAAIAGLLRVVVGCAPPPGEPQSCLQEANRVVTKRLEAGLVTGDLPAGSDVAVIASFYTTLIQGLWIQARDGASHASMMAIVDRAMAAWDALGAD